MLGRRDSQVKLNGERIELGEVEQLLGMSPLVSQCAAMPWGDQASCLHSYNKPLVGSHKNFQEFRQGVAFFNMTCMSYMHAGISYACIYVLYRYIRTHTHALEGFCDASQDLRATSWRSSSWPKARRWMAWLTWRSWPTVTATYRGSCDLGGRFVLGRVMGFGGFGGPIMGFQVEICSRVLIWGSRIWGFV